MFDMGDFLKAAGGGTYAPQVQNFSEATSLDDITTILKSGGGISSPSSGDRHIDVALTDISLAFMQDASGFVARRAFRTVPVRQRGNVYWTFPRGAFNRNEMKKRAPGTESAGTNYAVDTARYYCDVYALHVDVADQVRDNADSAFSIDSEITQLLTMKSMLNEEIDWRDKFFGGANFTATPGGTWAYVLDGVASSATANASLDPTNGSNNNVLHWNLPGTSTNYGPIEQVRFAKRYMQSQTGFGQRNMIMVMGREVFDILMDTPDIIDRIDRGQTPGGPAMTNEQNLAALFGLDEVIVMDAIENTADFGIADNHQFIGGKNALLLFRPPSAGLMTPAPGYTFLWSGFSGANGGGMRIKNMRIDIKESDRIEVQSAYEHNQVSSEMAVYFNGIVA